MLLLDKEHAGRPITACNAVNECRVEQLLLTDCRMELKEIAYTLNLSNTTVYRIVHDTLGYWKVSARWVPKELTEHHKAQRTWVSLNNMLCYQEDPAFLDNTVTGDETWIHHITPETKRHFMMWKHQWKHQSSPITKVQYDICPQSDGDCFLRHEGTPACWLHSQKWDN
jgi:hypothetical protein